LSFTNNKSIAAQFVEEVLNRGNLDKIKNLISPNIVWHGQYKKVKGLKSLKKWLSLEHNIFPDMRFKVVDNLAEHDKVAIRWILQSTLKKKPSNHQKLQIMGISIFQIEDDKIKEAWIAFDGKNLLKNY
jgi:predicted ester cyclase